MLKSCFLRWHSPISSVDNAIANMDAELNHWDFDKVCKETRSIWNEALGRIAVEGGTELQRDQDSILTFGMYC